METFRVINETVEKYEKYINPAVAKLFRFMGLATIEWEANGHITRDIKGNEYIDCLGGYGVFALGHMHPKVVNAVKKQLDKMALSSKVLFDKPMADLAELLAQIMPGGLQYSFFCNSGTEAIEGALKLARLHTGRKKIVSTVNSFHGKTFGALSATGRELFRAPFEPLLNDFSHVPFGDVIAMEAAVDVSTAAVIIEPIQGEGGIITPPEDYLPHVRRICDCSGALLICDEIQTGFGRTGRMFAVEHYVVAPDIITTVKALGGGVMPIGAFTAQAKVWEKLIENPFIHTTTFSGNPLACSAAIAAIEVIHEENLVQQAEKLGDYFMAGLKEIKARYPTVINTVRGKGLMLGIELTQEGIGGLLMSELINRGILVAYTLNNPKVILLEPPLNIPTAVIEQVLLSLE